MIEPSEHLSRVNRVTTGKVLVSADSLLDCVLIVNWVNRQTYLREGTVLGRMQIIDSSVVLIEEAAQPNGVGERGAAFMIMSEEVVARSNSSKAGAIPHEV